jgi:hypothetical protein
MSGVSEYIWTSPNLDVDTPAEIPSGDEFQETRGIATAFVFNHLLKTTDPGY